MTDVLISFYCRAVSKYLQTLFVKEAEQGRRSLNLEHLLVGKSRKEASRMFFETLVCPKVFNFNFLVWEVIELEPSMHLSHLPVPKMLMSTNLSCFSCLSPFLCGACTNFESESND